MLAIEEYISPLIRAQFPAFYNEEGELFIAFVKAYYEWAESNLQLLTFENDTDFNKQDTITQGDKTGTIIAVYNDSFMVELNQKEQFKCNTLCNDLTICTSSSGGSSYIQTARSFNHEYTARKLTEFRDIDQTIDKFIVSFKNKYLPDIQFNTESNKRLFIKNSLDFYRAKGTERAVDLFFKLIYAIEADVYYPGDDVFKLSDNNFINVQYLEVLASPNNVQLVGQTIRGVDSGAEAFVERLVRKKVGFRFIEVLYISNVIGSFRTKEQVITVGLTDNYSTKIIGSATSAQVQGTAAGHVVGDTLTAIDGTGRKARFRVESVENITGIVDFSVEKDGWGYSTDAQVIGSDKIIRTSNLNIENTNWYYDADPFRRFETIQQDLVSFTANTDANIDIIPVAQTVTFYDGSNTEFEGTVVSSNTSTGTIIVNYNSDTYANDSVILNVTELNNSGNTLTMNVESVTIVNATANVIASSKEITLQYSFTGDTQLQKGDILYQKNDRGVQFANAVVTLSTANVVASLFEVEVTRDVGVFRTNRPFYRIKDNAEYTLETISRADFGVINVNNTFYEDANTYGTVIGTHSPSKNFAFDTKATFSIESLKDTVEYYNFHASDTIDTANLNSVIDANAYGLSANGDLGFNDVIGDALPYVNVEIGSINQIVVTNNGELYGANPFYIVYDPKSEHLERYDYKIIYSGNEKNYRVGEIVEGANTGARALITVHDRPNKTILATRLNLETDNFPTTDASDISDFVVGETITGIDTNISSTITYVNETRERDEVGLNAVIASPTSSGNGFVSSVSVLDSGFGYFDGETINARNDRERESISSLEVSLGRQGIAPGYFTSRKGFLSSDKYIHDSDFYQEYSYQVLTSLPFDVYKRTLIDVLHVAGTRPFGKYVGTNVVKLNVTVSTQVSDFEIGKIDRFDNESIIYPPTRVVKTFRPGLFDFSGDNQFFANTDVIGGIVRPPLIEDTNEIETARVFAVLRPPVVADTDNFFATTVRHTLRPTIESDGDNFFATTVRQTLRPASINNEQTFETLDVRHTLRPTTEINSQSFNSVTLDEGFVRPALQGSGNQFFNVNLLAGTIYGPLDYVTSTGATATINDDITEYVSEEAT